MFYLVSSVSGVPTLEFRNLCNVAAVTSDPLNSKSRWLWLYMSMGSGKFISSSCVFAPVDDIFVFLLLSDSQTIMVVARMGEDFSGEAETATHKFQAAVVSPLWEGSVTRDLHIIIKFFVVSSK